MKKIIAIDGPAGVGKSSVAKKIAGILGITYVDTGAMYRSVGLYSLRNGIDKEDREGIISTLPHINIDMEYDGDGVRVYLNGEDVSKEIRTPDASMYASAVAVIKEVREKLVKIQQKLGEDKSVVMDGRDIGTKVFPEADLKIFLTAAPETRAERRYKELGEKVPYKEILEDIKKRDYNDSNREIDPLRPAEDAVILDNTSLNLEETAEKILELLKKAGS